MTGGVLLSGQTVESWQIVTLLGSIALVVLGAYGTLIIQNRNSTRSIRQRLFGAEGDETDDGFVQETTHRLDEMEDSQKQHAEQMHLQLYKLDRKMDVVLDIVAEEHEDLRLPSTVEDVEDVPPPPGDFYRGGSRGGQEHSDRDGPPAADD